MLLGSYRAPTAWWSFSLLSSCRHVSGWEEPYSQKGCPWTLSSWGAATVLIFKNMSKIKCAGGKYISFVPFRNKIPGTRVCAAYLAGWDRNEEHVRRISPGDFGTSWDEGEKLWPCKLWLGQRFFYSSGCVIQSDCKMCWFYFPLWI